MAWGGVSMTDHAVTSAAGTIGNWRARRGAKGKAPTDDEIRQEIRKRWPWMTVEQVEAVAEACRVEIDSR